jgi:hypothetical protein
MFTLFMRYVAQADQHVEKRDRVGECGLCDAKGMVRAVVGGQDGV